MYVRIISVMTEQEPHTLRIPLPSLATLNENP
jgi:hypothetical protein